MFSSAEMCGPLRANGTLCTLKPNMNNFRVPIQVKGNTCLFLFQNVIFSLLFGQAKIDAVTIYSRFTKVKDLLC